ncbi:MAG: PIN domain-containing protein [Chloroflexota bacterium]|nr:PIN domain-containing protein [Chloroflexota bacterium]
MEAVLLDTNYLVALELVTEQSHQAAERHWQSLQGKLPSLITTTYIFDEVMTFFNSRGQHQRAVKVGNSLRSSFVELVHVDEALFEVGWAYFVQHADKAYSLTDCISFVLMAQRGITTAFTFDHHFAQAGFTLVP